MNVLDQRRRHLLSISFLTLTPRGIRKKYPSSITIEGSFVGHEAWWREAESLRVALPDHKTAIKHVDILKTIDKPIDGIGHRVVQGGWYSRVRRRR